jgi:RNA polymerase sigma-70 factor (ECF subfamily)
LAEFFRVRVVLDAMTPRNLGELIDRHGPALVLYARQWCAGPEDVVQDAFLKLCALRTPPDDPPAWLFRVVRNGALDAAKADRRRQKREATAQSNRWFVEPDIDGLDAEKAVEALERLPPELRETIVARMWGGLTFEQIADVSGCSASSAFRRYEAGIAALRETLGVPCPTDPTR